MLGAHYFSDVNKSNSWTVEAHKKEFDIMRFRL